MLKLISGLIKLSLFALLVIVLANYFKVGGKTVSDQVRVKMAQAERSAVARKLGEEAQAGAHVIRQKFSGITSSPVLSGPAPAAPTKKAAPPEEADDGISETERHKLRELIRELNTAR